MRLPQTRPDVASHGQQAADFDGGHQSLKAARYWCHLLSEHRPDELLAATVTVFRRWPASDTATRLYEAAGDRWPDHRDDVLARLAASPHHAVAFARSALGDLHLAWNLAHSLNLTDGRTWSDLATAYAKVDPLAVRAGAGRPGHGRPARDPPAQTPPAAGVRPRVPALTGPPVIRTGGPTLDG